LSSNQKFGLSSVSLRLFSISAIIAAEYVFEMGLLESQQRLKTAVGEKEINRSWGKRD
jgi:hypothetical protein